MLKSRTLVSMPIISLEEGFQVGTVRSLVVDPETKEVAALVMTQRGWLSEQKIVPFSKIRSTGNDAVTIDKSASVQKIIKLPELIRLIKLKADPIGTRVVTENGTVLGLVEEYYIDENTGKITALEITGKFLENIFKGKARLSSDLVRTMGANLVIVKEGAEDHLEKTDNGFQETLHSLKQGTAHLWVNTKEKTRQFGKSLKEKYEKKESEPTTGEPNPGEPGEITIRDEEILPDISASPEDSGSSGSTAPSGQSSPPKEGTE